MDWYKISVRSLSAQPAAKLLAGKWLAKLENLEARLGEDEIQQLTPGYGDRADLESLRKNREALLKAIQGAKLYFSDMAR